MGKADRAQEKVEILYNDYASRIFCYQIVTRKTKKGCKLLTYSPLSCYISTRSGNRTRTDLRPQDFKSY